MRKIFFIMQFFIYSGYACPVPLDILPSNIKGFFEDYRNIKSKVFVTSGARLIDGRGDKGKEKARKEIWEKYMHEMFYGVGESGDEVIYILSNEYSVLSIDFVENEEMKYWDGWDLIKTTKEDCYRIIVREKVVGAIHNGNIDNSISTIYDGKDGAIEWRCDIYITKDRPKVESDTGYSCFFILEHDVPVLMENIKKGLDIVKPYRPDREKDKETDYVVEWW